MTHLARLLPLSMILLAAGCTPPLESQVSGTVTLDGSPMQAGNVIFHPAGTGVPAYGTIQPDGTYSVKTGQGEGMQPGEYVVVVKATEKLAPSEEAGAVEVLPKLLTPQKYATKDTTPLKYTVEAGEQTIDLELKSE